MDCSLPLGVRELLWDVDPTVVDVRRHAHFIVRRVLDYGDARDLDWLRRTYTDDEIRSVVRARRGLARKTLVFWNCHYALLDRERTRTD
jgi:hypothetical protein